jgi:hypothetical protein
MANIIAIFNCNDSGGRWADEDVVASSVNTQSVKIDMPNKQEWDGKLVNSTLKLGLASKRFNKNTPGKGEVFAAELDPTSIRRQGRMNYCSNYKILAVGADAVAAMALTPVTTAVPDAPAVEKAPF